MVLTVSSAVLFVNVVIGLLKRASFLDPALEDSSVGDALHTKASYVVRIAGTQSHLIFTHTCCGTSQKNSKPFSTLSHPSTTQLWVLPEVVGGRSKLRLQPETHKRTLLEIERTQNDFDRN